MEKYAALIENIEAYALLAEAGKVEKLEQPFHHTRSDGSKVLIVKVFGPYKRPDLRSIILLQDESGKTYTMSYPKYLMQQHLGYELGDATIDHWDTNVENNNLDNLKVIDRAEHSKQDTRRVRLVKLKCAGCGKDFERSPRLLRDKHKKGATGIFCSRQCSGKYNREVQLGLRDKLPVQDYVPSEYYKAKYEKQASSGMDKHEELAWKLRARIKDQVEGYASFTNGDVSTPRQVGAEVHKGEHKDVLEIAIGALSYEDERGPFYSYSRLYIYPDLQVAIKTDPDFPTELLPPIERSIKEVRAEIEEKRAFIDYLLTKYAKPKPAPLPYAKLLHDKVVGMVKDYDWFAGDTAAQESRDGSYFEIKAFITTEEEGPWVVYAKIMVVDRDLNVMVKADKDFPQSGLDAIEQAKQEVWHDWYHKHEVKAFVDYVFTKYAINLKQYARTLWQKTFDLAKDYATFKGIDNVRGPIDVNGEKVYEFLIAAHRGKYDAIYTIVQVHSNMDIQIDADPDFPPELLDCIEQAKQLTYQEFNPSL